MRPESRKQEIINAAAILFKEKGYSAVTMRDLAKAMGIKAASLYNHIQSKQEILSTIIIDLAEEFTTGMNQIANSDQNAIQKLQNIINLHIDVTLRNSDGLASLNNDWMHLEEENLQYFEKMRHEYEESFRNIVYKGVDKGDIKSYNIEIMVFSTLSTLRTLYLWYPKQKNIDADILKRDMMSVLLKGIV
ncbi:TetR/AcrR family transcriptional regulator [Aquimarina sp. AD10]|uniref:TetR family transcriptional regulator n=1 Tax=Aquimarina aggregata TaxID=1642818 RepID=A0A163CW70_9FLAO|nr:MULTISPECIES: TetR/AcrR family transcriptional regulator [Aquimarina]AXT62776.1 TetR/AcrR family transcriptional regulator [Aquimarina sp. AD10]KZS42812.1 TetR family transcriptional regulator [Aquimarina aggregata]RKN01960.1 TetR/AcrR family transcriptional regulator [Aquimarina sp. AD10]